MLAIIRSENGSTYVSPVFAISNKKYFIDKEGLIFDSTYTHIQKVALQRAYFLEWEKFSVNKKGWTGYDWVVQNKELFKCLRNQNSLSIEEFPDFKPYAKKIELPEWIELCAQKDIDGLIICAAAFHDGTIGAYRQEGDTCFLKIEGGFISADFTLKLVGVTENNIVDKVGMILNSEITKTEEGLCWAITDGFAGWTDGVDFDAPFEKSYVKCKRIFWKIEFDNED